MASKQRSPNYPAIGLAEAVAALQKIWDREKRTPVSIEIAGKAMGYKSISGPVRTKIAALRKYGLVEDVGGNLRISDLGMRILHSSAGTGDYLEALNEAALHPELFRELYGTHGDASDDSLRSHLVIRKKFTEAGAKQLIKAFRDTLSIVHPSESSYSESEGGAMSEPATATVRRADSDNKTAGIRIGGPAVLHPTPSTFVWPLSKGVTAQLTITGADVRPAHFETLAKYLQLAKTAIEAEEEQ